VEEEATFEQTSVPTAEELEAEEPETAEEPPAEEAAEEEEEEEKPPPLCELLDEAGTTLSLDLELSAPLAKVVVYPETAFAEVVTPLEAHELAGVPRKRDFRAEFKAEVEEIVTELSEEMGKARGGVGCFIDLL
jgi:hypothetical protein